MFVGSRFLKYIGSFIRCSRLCTCENVDTDSLEGSEFKLSRILVFSCFKTDKSVSLFTS